MEAYVSSTEGNLRIGVTKPVVTMRAGPVQVTGLQDSLNIKTSHRNIDVSDVASQVTIEPLRHLSLKDVKGNVAIDSSSDSISADNVRSGSS
jgi:hypothetical protein